jgi:hypothetical protein
VPWADGMGDIFLSTAGRPVELRAAGLRRAGALGL